MDFDKEFVQDFLDQKYHEGSKVDEGAFSVEPEAEKRKLRAHLGIPYEFYALKLIQGAVASGATEIQVRGSFGRLSVEFHTTRPLFTGPQWSRALKGPMQVSDFGLRSLALACLLVSGRRDVCLQTSGSSNSFRHKDGEPLEPVSNIDSNRWTYKFTWGAAIKPDFDKTEIEAIRYRCQYSSVPIFINGKRAIPDTERFLAEYSEGEGGLVFNAPSDLKAYLPTKDGRLRPPEGKETFLFMGNPGAAKRTFHLGLSRAGTAKVVFVVHGVAVKGTVIDRDFPLRGTAIIDASGFRTEVCGLKMVKNLEWKACLRESAETLNFLVSAVQNHLAQWKPTREELIKMGYPSPTEELMISPATCSICLGAALSPLTPLIIPIAAGLGGCYALLTTGARYRLYKARIRKRLKLLCQRRVFVARAYR